MDGALVRLVQHDDAILQGGERWGRGGGAVQGGDTREGQQDGTGLVADAASGRLAAETIRSSPPAPPGTLARRRTWLSMSSSSASRSSMPSVMYLMTVCWLVQSSKRMAYPTCSGRGTRGGGVSGGAGQGRAIQ